MALSLGTLLLLQRCLDAQQLNVGDPDFDTTAHAILKAKWELADAIQLASSPPPTAGES